MEDLTAVLSSKPTHAGRLAWLISLSGLITYDQCESLFAGISCFFRQALSIARSAFGCWHRHISRPFTMRGRTYEVCFDCGKELPYSLEQMARVKE
jgi:hypothetical protein